MLTKDRFKEIEYNTRFVDIGIRSCENPESMNILALIDDDFYKNIKIDSI